MAQVRKVEPSPMEKLIEQNSDRRFLGIFGEDGVNVLKLNAALDSLSKA
ncbi:potassium-transporting ATPase subunit C [Pseudanabaena sp. FACHB-1998]|nr:potassium-transporting ATPase subunit C [Pseudanabaena sp. FACHB-1998]